MIRNGTIPQSKIEDFCQPPLHKGAFSCCRAIANFQKYFIMDVRFDTQNPSYRVRNKNTSEVTQDGRQQNHRLVLRPE